jgi:hypothetical protein
MRFLTKDESRGWCKGDPPFLDNRGHPVTWPPGFQAVRFVFTHEPASRLFWLSQLLVDAIEYWDEALLWVVLSGVWGSSENMHLYYRLRLSYGDHRHLEQAPGHLVLRHERVDMTTLLHICMLMGWDAFLFTGHDYGRVYVSHDEYGEIALRDPRGQGSIQRELQSGSLKCELLSPAV